MYRNLLVHISIALRRIREGYCVPLQKDELAKIRDTREFEVAKNIAARISSSVSIDLPEEEVAYISLHLAGKRVLSPGSSADAEGLVISDEVWDLVSRMLELVWNTFRFDFRGDLELRMNLARHIVPLGVRLTHHFAMENPILSDIKARYPLAYSMAIDASSVLAEHYGAALSEPEIGYIALGFALAIERQKTELPKKNILVVCASGRGSAKLLEYRYREEFGEYLNRIETCDVMQVEKVDFSGIDYVFTTVPLPCALPVPVRQVSFFLDGDDIASVRDAIRGEAGPSAESGVLSVVDPQLFFTHLVCSSREEAIGLLIDAASRRHHLDADFKGLVWKRERLAPTAFGNNVALPHPLSPASDDTFIAVALLDRSIDWGGQQVQAVFLLSIARDGDDNLEAIYDVLADVLMSERAVATLLSDQRLETLRQICSSIHPS